MSSITTTIDTQINARRYSVSNTLLLSLYLVIPVSIAIVLIDLVFLDSYLRYDVLPANPASLMLWVIIFNLPHIFSSFITLADKEYLSFYRERFTKAMVVILSVVIGITYVAPIILPQNIADGLYTALFVFFGGYTMYHVLSQQFGLGMMMMRQPPSRVFEAWRWTGTIATTLMYFLVLFKYMFSFWVFDMDSADIALYVAAFFVVVSVLLGSLLASKTQQKVGFWYVQGNNLMLIVLWVLVYMDYSFFVIAIPRIIHDLTAFIIYSVHDQNRNQHEYKNNIYRALRFIPLKPLLLCSLLAMVVAMSFQCTLFFIDIGIGFSGYGGGECIVQNYYAPEGTTTLPQSMRLGVLLFFICGLFHYYIEGFVWKRDSIHRHSVTFK